MIPGLRWTHGDGGGWGAIDPAQVRDRGRVLEWRAQCVLVCLLWRPICLTESFIISCQCLSIKEQWFSVKKGPLGDGFPSLSSCTRGLSWGAQPQVLLMVSGSWPLSRALSVSCPCFSALLWHDPEHLPQTWGEDFTSITQCLENALEWQPRSGQWWLPRPRFSAPPGTWVTKSQSGGYAPSRHPQLHPVRTGALSQSWPGIPLKPVPPDPAPTLSSLLLSCDATPTGWEGQLEDCGNGLEDHGKRRRPGQSATGLGHCNWKWRTATCSTVKRSIVPHDVFQSNGLHLFLFFKNLVVLGQPSASLWALSAYPPLPGHPSAVPWTPPRGWPELDQAWVTVTPLEKNITSDYTIYFLFMCQ